MSYGKLRRNKKSLLDKFLIKPVKGLFITKGVSLINMIFFVIISVACSPVKPPSFAAEHHDEFASVFEEHLDCYPLAMVASMGQKISVKDETIFLATLYHQKGLSPVWVTKEGPTPKAITAFDFLSRSDEEGLVPRDYDTERISRLIKNKDYRSLAELDTLLTLNTARYIHDVTIGQLKLKDSAPSLFSETGDTEFNPINELDKLIEAKDAGSYLSSLSPSNHNYSDLKAALKKYRDIEKKGGWEQIPQGKKIEPGDQDNRIPLLIKRLRVSEDLDQDIKGISLTHYDSHLKKAVMGFQARHSLEPDGVIGTKTIEVLNIPVSENIRQIILNMTRWRSQYRDLGDKYVIVNIAGYNLSAFEKGEEVLNFPVIVGKLQNQTPVFNSLIRQVDFHPYWNVTPSIARNEELPKLRKNPSYFDKKHMRLYSSWGPGAVEIDPRSVDWKTANLSRYRVRQDPGPWNALGKVKFVFPNKYDVYMHDTPTQNLFSRAGRGFSHGCIRVSKPIDLAEFLLVDSTNKWTREKIEKSIKTGKRQVVNLVSPVPVYITYQTSWVDKNGIIYFNRDIYNRDKKLMTAIFSGDDQG